MTTFDSEYTTRILRDSGVDVVPEQHEMLEQYAILLQDWNARVNLISRKDVDDLWRNHLLHSLAGLTLIDIPDGAHVIDVGTGGGLPGIPLAILRPDARFVLIDSIAKKIRAVQDIIQAIGLQNVTAYTGRMEDSAAGHPAADIVVTRAVARLEKLIAWCRPAMKPGARLYAWKGGDLDDEIREVAADAPKMKVVRHEFALNGETYFKDEGKCLIEVQYS